MPSFGPASYIRLNEWEHIYYDPEGHRLSDNPCGGKNVVISVKIYTMESYLCRAFHRLCQAIRCLGNETTLRQAEDKM